VKWARLRCAIRREGGAIAANSTEPEPHGSRWGFYGPNRSKMSWSAAITEGRASGWCIQASTLRRGGACALAWAEGPRVLGAPWINTRGSDTARRPCLPPLESPPWSFQPTSGSSFNCRALARNTPAASPAASPAPTRQEPSRLAIAAQPKTQQPGVLLAAEAHHCDQPRALIPTPRESTGVQKALII
jgi:hypothetical protein